MKKENNYILGLKNSNKTYRTYTFLVFFPIIILKLSLNSQIKPNNNEYLIMF